MIIIVDQALVTQAKQLTRAEPLDLIGELWQSLKHDVLTVTDAERTMLNELMTDLSANPGLGRPWGPVEAECAAAFRESFVFFDEADVVYMLAISRERHDPDATRRRFL